MSSGGCRHLSSEFRPLRALGRTGDGTAGNLKMTKIKHYCIKHFTYILSRVLCPVPCLHFYRSFCLETEKRPRCPKSVPLCQKRF
ncbi:unnamed protein product [Staurois parvus]|uniref:Uncharacterized protein n=1 Tax=Staurois parvus TaxID=386267 RepID=A0ABN9FQC0_9NEOB|nr:unnamed protein product [Staurois parvus]